MENKLFVVTTLVTSPSKYYKKYDSSHSNIVSGSIQEKIMLTEEYRLPKPRKRKLFEKNNIKIYESFIEYNKGVIIIEASSHKEAYDTYILMKFFFGLSKGMIRSLQEVEEIYRFPRNNFSINDFFKLFCRFEISTIWFDKNNFFYGKKNLSYLDKNNCIDFIKTNFEDKALIECMKHYVESLEIFDFGLFNDVTYDEYLSEYEFYKLYKDNDYNENGFKYQIAFTAAFKGIECFFKVNDLKNNKISNTINNLDFANICANTKYELMFEKDIHQQNTTISLEEIIAKYLKMRNTSGAHNNENIPLEKKIFRENVFEIQLLLKRLILTKYYNEDSMNQIKY